MWTTTTPHHHAAIACMPAPQSTSGLHNSLYKEWQTNRLSSRDQSTSGKTRNLSACG